MTLRPTASLADTRDKEGEGGRIGLRLLFSCVEFEGPAEQFVGEPAKE